MQLAFSMGRQMARTERRLIPYLSGVHHHTSYPQFVLMHRHRLEQYTAFEPWEVRIVELADSEARRLGIKPESQRSWEFTHNCIETPLRSAFWYGWETAYRLRHLYTQQIELYRREHERPSVLRVHNPPQSPLIPCSPLPEKMADDERWDSLATEIFDNLKGDSNEAFWELPPAEDQGSKTKSS